MRRAPGVVPMKMSLCLAGAGFGASVGPAAGARLGEALDACCRRRLRVCSVGHISLAGGEGSAGAATAALGEPGAGPGPRATAKAFLVAGGGLAGGSRA